MRHHVFAAVRIFILMSVSALAISGCFSDPEPTPTPRSESTLGSSQNTRIAECTEHFQVVNTLGQYSEESMSDEDYGKALDRILDRGLTRATCADVWDRLEPIPTPTPIPIAANEVVANAVTALTEAGSVWFLLEHENGFTEALGGLQLQRVEGAINEVGMSISAEANLGRIYIEVDAVLIGLDTWLTNPLTGEWESLPNEENPIGFIQPIAAVKDVLGGLSDPQFLEQPVPGEDFLVTSPLQAEVMKSLLGDIKPDAVGVGEVLIDDQTFEMKSARITGALQVLDTDETVRILEMSRYGEEFIIEPPIE